MQVPFNTLPADSRVWVYQANRLLTAEESSQINEVLGTFAQNWQSHGQPVHAWAELRYNLFAVFAADEKASGVSGCSIDSSVACLREIGTRFNIDWFDRLTLAVEGAEQIYLLPRADFAAALSSGKLKDDSKVFDNTITDLAGLQHKWQVPFSESWAAAMAR